MLVGISALALGLRLKKSVDNYGDWDGCYNLILSVGGSTNDPSKLEKEYRFAMDLIDKALMKEEK